MTVSLNLNDVRAKNRERDQLAADVERFMASKRQPVSVPPSKRSKPGHYDDFRLPGTPIFPSRETQNER